MKTKIHAYNFDTTKPAEKAAYAALVAKLKTGPRWMKSHGGQGHYDFVRDLDGQEIELETAHLFDNQWNTAPIEGKTEKGLRVFDWAEDVIYINGRENKTTKRGHWLEQTDEMREIRRNVDKCGYCGKQEPAAKGYVFCPHCLDSEYLKESELHLTRMACIADRDKPRAPLTEAERAHLLPLYRDAQLHGSTERGTARLAKQRADIEAKFRTETANAKAERDGLIWLLDHGIKIDNCIYYSHTAKFSFGWRSPVSDDIRGRLLQIISEFPFPYEIKCADGKTLEGY